VVTDRNRGTPQSRSRRSLARHTMAAGASLGVRLPWYRRVGGIPMLACGEDRELVSRLAAAGARVRTHCAAHELRSSGRASRHEAERASTPTAIPMAWGQIEFSRLGPRIAHPGGHGPPVGIPVNLTHNSQRVLGAARVRNPGAPRDPRVVETMRRYVSRSAGRHLRLGRCSRAAGLNLPRGSVWCYLNVSATVPARDGGGLPQAIRAQASAA
jgi:hypothetical protein